MDGWRLPLPQPEEIPSGLRSLIAVLLRAKEQQEAYSHTPVAQMFWPDARVQYVAQPSPGVYYGGAVNYDLGQRPDWRLGLALQSRF